MRYRTVLAAAIVVAATGCGLGIAAATGSPASPPPDTIVEVAGDAATGFEIQRYDGSWLYPPTDSETRAECGEYDARIDRVRCRVEARTWFRDLADLQQALGWAHTTAAP